MSSPSDRSMRHESSQQVEDLFCAALREERENRAEFVAANCGQDFELRDSVLQLLDCHQVNEDSGFILDQPAVSVHSQALHAADAPIAEREGDTIGRYRLLEKIGEGGMGVVYMAEPLEGVRRQVALKIIKLGMDTRQVIARFEVEQQAMAMFDHTNITRVFDAGATEAGRPYFVMELVRGVDIISFVTENSVGLRQRLELFVTVCRAVQHSHQKGIIHRDLKPSNILITCIDGVAIPKVIDFGIAKALDQRLTEKTLFTQYAAIMGTPQYMSPEQAELSGCDVDTRSDIYSLGILLYELTTGSTPLDKDIVKGLHPIALLDTLRQHDIETPSIRLSKQDSTEFAYGLGSLANFGGTRHELDCVVMKAVARDRADRYPSATELAADIQRFLNGDPVEAVAPTRIYRLRSYLSRNRKAVLVATFIGTLLLVSLGVCSRFALNTYRANQDKEQTVIELSAALQELSTKHEELILAQRRISETAENQAYHAAMKTAVAKFHWAFYQEIAHLLPSYQDQDSVAAVEQSGKLPQDGEQFVHLVPPHYFDFQVLCDLKNRYLVEAELRRLENYAKIVNKKISFESSDVVFDDKVEPSLKIALAKEIVNCRSKFFRVLLKEYRAAFGAQDPKIARTLNLLALSLIESGRYPEAEALLGEALAISDEPKTMESSHKLMEMIQAP